MSFVALVISMVFLFLDGRFLPDWINWENKTLSYDLDGDGIPETLILKDRQLKIYKDNNGNKEDISPPLSYFYKISDAYCGDINDDGINEVLLLVWKRGQFGTSRPFWIEHDEIGFSEHIFIYRYHNGEMRRYWMSSGIGLNVSHGFMDDNARLHLETIDGQEIILKWEPYALKRVDN